MSESKALAKTHKRILEPNARHLDLVRLLVEGLDRSHSSAPDKALGVPLSLDEAAQVLRMRLKHVRRILAEPSMQAAMAKALAQRRSAAHPMVLAQLESIAASPIVAPKPSDIIAAGKLILGEDASKGLSVNVGVQVNANSDAIRPGYIIRLPAKPEPKTIEGEAQ